MTCAGLLCAMASFNMPAAPPPPPQPEPAPLYVMLASHFDIPWSMGLDDIEGFRQLSVLHPKMKWTHLFNPVVYTQYTPLLDEIGAYLIESRDVYDAEIGLHIHMYKSLVQAAGVTFQASPTWSGSPPECGTDNSGYSVPISSYDRQDILAVLDFGLDTLEAHGFGRPRAFCPGGWAANEEQQSALAELDIRVSAAALPPGTEYGAEMGICWYMLCGWGYGTVTHTTPPYLVSTQTMMPDGPPPYLLTSEGPLLEIPQVCKVDWMVTADDMKAIFLLHYAMAAAGQPTAVCLAIHDVYGQDEFAKFHEVLSYIDAFVENPAVPVIYATASEIREAFLPLLATPGDVDGNGLVDIDDIFAVLGAWGPCDDPDDCPADLNDDGVVDIDDIFQVLANWGPYS